ncbi:hypothetical protein FRC03_003253 [Tulasnella sp. 419]|nr:hypothetical protein FRC03_003253 [Tulasnella sp. 419]
MSTGTRYNNPIEGGRDLHGNLAQMQADLQTLFSGTENKARTFDHWSREILSLTDWQGLIPQRIRNTREDRGIGVDKDKGVGEDHPSHPSQGSIDARPASVLTPDKGDNENNDEKTQARV